MISISTSRQLSNGVRPRICMVKRPIHRLTGNHAKPEIDELAEEVVISILKGSEVQVRLLATPKDLEDLAFGHFISEGRGSINSATVDGYNVSVSGIIEKRPSEDLLTAACGACTSGDIIDPTGIIDSNFKFHHNLKDTMNEMKKNQQIFHKTGGTHAAAIFDKNGKLIIIREDVGRHNTVDKVIGAAKRQSLDIGVIAVSGRVGWEIVAKCVRTNVPIILAVGAISSSAEILARKSGMTLVGFAASPNPSVIGELNRIIDKE